MTEKHVDPRCAESDKQNKLLAIEYRQVIKMIKRRISDIHREMRASEYVPASSRKDKRNRKRRKPQAAPTELRERLRILNDMCRTTTEISREVEHYYERGWWRSEAYTFNTRKRG